VAAVDGRRQPRGFLSRFDWARTSAGRWQLLEINSDTPAGLWEAGLAAGQIARLHERGAPPGVEFWPRLTAAWRTTVVASLRSDASETPLAVGLVRAVAAPEDFDQLRAHERAARAAFPAARLVLGDIGELRVDDEGAWLRSTRLDVLFRYYPLDWCVTPRWAPLLKLVAGRRLVMIPPASAVVSQSKAFLALLHELDRHGFFPPEDAAAVRAYVPPTSLDPRPFRHADWVAKPFLEREGHGVRFAHELHPAERRHLEHADVVFQQWLALASVRVPIATAQGWRTEERFLVFGVFLAAGEIAGIYTRAGAPITGREAVFVPVLIDQ
jgi:glutathionylspermidine synthase